MRKLLAVFLTFLTFTLAACDDEPTAAERASAPKQAFDLASLLDQEVKTLASQSVSVRKTIFADGKAQETKTMQNLDWSAELASFYEIDLNKPALMGLFIEEQTVNTDGLAVKTYTAKEGARTNVKKAEYTFNEQGKLLRADATIRQENLMFKTSKEMHLAFDPSGVPRLQSYRLDETQELRFMSPEQYGVAGEVVK